MNKLYNDTAVQAIANAIRSKNGSSDTYNIAEMSTALNDFSYYAKPTISNVALATFEADGLPLNKLKVAINAVQSGSGDPSPTNIRPISGWDAANVSDVGKNLFNSATVTVNKGIDSTGQIVNSSSSVISDYIPVKPNVNYYLTCYNDDGNRRTNFYDSEKNFISTTEAERGSRTFTAPTNASYCIISIGKTNYEDAQLEIGTSATTYEPYNGTTTTITLPQTVYGGEVDVVNGVLKITDGYIASYNGETLPSKWISSMDVYAEGTTPTTGAEVCYELAEPIIINLTPSLIKSLNGQNNLSVDCGEVLELEYFKEV